MFVEVLCQSPELNSTTYLLALSGNCNLELTKRWCGGTVAVAGAACGTGEDHALFNGIVHINTNVRYSLILPGTYLVFGERYTRDSFSFLM